MTSFKHPQATGPRVMVMEAIERHGGTLRSRHGVQARLIAIHGELCNSRLPILLRDMEKAGLVALNTTIGANHSTKITEVMVVEIPPNFLAPISALRSKKNVPWSRNPVQPEKPEAGQGRPDVPFEMPHALSHLMAEVEVEERIAERAAIGAPVPHPDNAVVEHLMEELRTRTQERDALRAENESLRATVVRQATLLAAQ